MTIQKIFIASKDGLPLTTMVLAVYPVLDVMDVPLDSGATSLSPARGRVNEE
jgi:hypothetical protein